jgi:hypothetical protein
MGIQSIMIDNKVIENKNKIAEVLNKCFYL